MTGEIVVISKEELVKLIDEAVTRAMTNYVKSEPKKVEYISVAEAAKILGVSQLTVYRGVQKGNIPSKKIGRKIKILSSYL